MHFACCQYSTRVGAEFCSLAFFVLFVFKQTFKIFPRGFCSPPTVSSEPRLCRQRRAWWGFHTLPQWQMPLLYVREGSGMQQGFSFCLPPSGFLSLLSHPETVLEVCPALLWSSRWRPAGNLVSRRISPGILNCPAGSQAASKTLWKCRVFSSYFYVGLPLRALPRVKHFLGPISPWESLPSFRIRFT